MLKSLDKVRKQVEGRLPAVDAWLDVRRELLVQYMKLAGLRPPFAKTLPAPEELSDFCDRLIDYISAGHFEIYEILIAAYEKADNRHLMLSNKIIDRIQDTTETILDFNERYSSISDDDDLMSLDNDLNHLGLTLEERFKWEDKLVLVLDVFGHQEEQAQSNISA